jgi:hypothetical protein
VPLDVDEVSGTHSVQPAGNPRGNQFSARDERVPADLRKDSASIMTSCWPRKNRHRHPDSPADLRKEQYLKLSPQVGGTLSGPSRRSGTKP